MSNPIDPKRRTGRTTRIIIGAPRGAWLVCPDGALGAFRNACARLCRSDLRLRSIGVYNIGRLTGVDPAMIVFDHSVDPANAVAPYVDTFAALIVAKADADRAYNIADDAVEVAHIAIVGARAKVYKAQCALDEYVAQRVAAAGGTEQV